MEQRTDKLKLFEMTFQKVSADKNFIAYYLEQISQIENRTQSQVRAYLNCSPEHFYKLGLSKTPDTFAADYTQRLHNICEFSGIAADKLNYILLQVNTFHHITSVVERQTLEHFVFSGWQTSNNSILKKTFQASVQVDHYLKSLYSKLPVNAYRSGFAMLAVLFTIFISTTRVDEKSFYASANTDFKDSAKHLALKDNTYVHKPHFKKV